KPRASLRARGSRSLATRAGGMKPRRRRHKDNQGIEAWHFRFGRLHTSEGAMVRRTWFALAVFALLPGWVLLPGQEGAVPQPARAREEALPAGALARLGAARFLNFGRPFALAFSPDGKALAVGSWDGAITQWDLATRQPVREWDGHPGPVTALAFAPDGQTLASGGKDRAIHLWRGPGRPPPRARPRHTAPRPRPPPSPPRPTPAPP